MQNKTKQIERNTNILQTILAQVKKKKKVIWKRTEENSKNLSQNELNQIAEIRDQSLDENSKEELIISLLKSTHSIAELFNSNLYDDKISDIRRILNRLRDILPKSYIEEIRKKLYEIEKIMKIFWKQKKKKMSILEN